MRKHGVLSHIKACLQAQQGQKHERARNIGG